MNFPYHTESISQHVHHFKPIKNFWKKKLIIFREGGMGGFPFAENSAKIIYLIFEPFPQFLLLFQQNLIFMCQRSLMITISQFSTLFLNHFTLVITVLCLDAGNESTLQSVLPSNNQEQQHQEHLQQDGSNHLHQPFPQTSTAR